MKTTEPIWYELQENNIRYLAAKHNLNITSLKLFLIDLFGSKSLPDWIFNTRTIRRYVLTSERPHYVHTSEKQ